MCVCKIVVWIYRKNILVVVSNQLSQGQGTIGDSMSKCEMDALPMYYDPPYDFPKLLKHYRLGWNEI